MFPEKKDNKKTKQNKIGNSYATSHSVPSPQTWVKIDSNSI